MITPSLSDYPPTAWVIHYARVNPTGYLFKMTSPPSAFKMQRGLGSPQQLNGIRAFQLIIREH
jgi:hypothetical protein